jgi:hypothetical protein
MNADVIDCAVNPYETRRGGRWMVVRSSSTEKGGRVGLGE